MPDPLPKPNVCNFLKSRKRAMTGREAAEHVEVSATTARRRAEREAQAEYDENARWQTIMIAERRERLSQRTDKSTIQDSEYDSSGSREDHPDSAAAGMYGPRFGMSSY